MAVKLVFLGRLEDAAGTGEREVPGVASLEALFAGLDADLVLALADPRIKIAVNGALVSDRAGLVISDGDEVAFLPPVSGG